MSFVRGAYDMLTVRSALRVSSVHPYGAETQLGPFVVLPSTTATGAVRSSLLHHMEHLVLLPTLRELQTRCWCTSRQSSFSEGAARLVRLALPFFLVFELFGPLDYLYQLKLEGLDSAESATLSREVRSL